MKDEGRPLGAGLREQAPNHLKLHWSRAIVVSVKEKAGLDLVWCESRSRIKVNRITCRKLKGDVKTEGLHCLGTSPRGACLLLALCANVSETLPPL